MKDKIQKIKLENLKNDDIVIQITLSQENFLKLAAKALLYNKTNVLSVTWESDSEKEILKELIREVLYEKQSERSEV